MTLSELLQKINITTQWQGHVGVDYEVPMDYLSVGKHTVSLLAYGMVVCVRGEMEYTINGEAFSLKAGQLAVFMPYTLAYVVSKSADFCGSMLLCEHSIFDRLMLENGRDVGHVQLHKTFPVVTLNDSQQSDLNMFILLLVSAINNQRCLQGQLVMSMLRSMHLFLADLLSPYIDAISLTNQRDAIFRDFMKYATMHYMQEHNLTFYSNKLCISTAYLSRIVREVSGRSVKEIISQMLFTEARYLLCNTSQPVTAISASLGFEDQSAFTHFFRRHSGKTPVQFRQDTQ